MLHSQGKWQRKTQDTISSFLENGLKGTPVKSIDSIESRRFPFIVENTTNMYNSDSPIINSGYVFGTNLGRNNEDKCIC